ncbi:hypothetical protein R3P38DRAFT_2470579, partial [Favolaschia claudopus]
MIRVAHKYNLTFTALTIENQVKLSLPIWRHPGIRKSDYDSINRRKTAECLRVNHRTRTVDEAMTLATRKTTVARKPHTINQSGMARQNCGCPSCRRDRNELGCKNPGKCVDTAKALINCLPPKWNPTIANQELRVGLALTDNEIEVNARPLEVGEAKCFDPNFRLSSTENGFRIFAFEESLN